MGLRIHPNGRGYHVSGHVDELHDIHSTSLCLSDLINSDETLVTIKPLTRRSVNLKYEMSIKML